MWYHWNRRTAAYAWNSRQWCALILKTNLKMNSLQWKPTLCFTLKHCCSLRMALRLNLVLPGPHTCHVCVWSLPELSCVDVLAGAQTEMWGLLGVRVRGSHSETLAGKTSTLHPWHLTAHFDRFRFTSYMLRHFSETVQSAWELCSVDSALTLMFVTEAVTEAACGVSFSCLGILAGDKSWCQSSYL